MTCNYSLYATCTYVTVLRVSLLYKLAGRFIPQCSTLHLVVLLIIIIIIIIIRKHTEPIVGSHTISVASTVEKMRKTVSAGGILDQPLPLPPTTGIHRTISPDGVPVFQVCAL